jgi:hypothetical protein
LHIKKIIVPRSPFNSCKDIIFSEIVSNSVKSEAKVPLSKILDGVSDIIYAYKNTTIKVPVF